MATPHALVGFGASSMQGTGDSQGGWFARAGRLATGVHAQRQWINQGIGGNTTRDMVARIDKVTAVAPYDLVVLLGCNDVPRPNDANLSCRTSPQEYERNLAALLPAIGGSSSLLITTVPVCPRRVGIDDHTFETYVDISAAQAKAAGYDVWDLYRQLKGKADAFWAPDGVHFNDAGHQWIAEQFLARL